MTQIDDTEIKGLVLQTQTEATSIVITDDDSYVRAGDFLVEIKKRLSRIDAVMDPHIMTAHKAHKALLATKKGMTDPLNTLYDKFEDGVKVYKRAQDAKRLEEQRKADAEAKKKAEDERIKQAEEAMAFGDKEAAEKLLDTPVVVSTVSMPSATPKLAGTSFRKKWCYRIVDPAKIPRQYLIVDESKIRKYGETMEEHAWIPGVEFYPDEVSATRSR